MLHAQEKEVAAPIVIDEAAEGMPGVGTRLNVLWRIIIYTWQLFSFLAPLKFTAVVLE